MLDSIDYIRQIDADRQSKSILIGKIFVFFHDKQSRNDGCFCYTGTIACVTFKYIDLDDEKEYQCCYMAGTGNEKEYRCCYMARNGPSIPTT